MEVGTAVLDKTDSTETQSVRADAGTQLTPRKELL